VTVGGITTTINNLEYLAYNSSGGILADQNSTTAGGYSITVTTNIGGTTVAEVINASAASDFSSDSIVLSNNVTATIIGSGAVISIGAGDTVTVAAAPNETSFHDTVNASTTAATL
jgi:hypothetical protein